MNMKKNEKNNMKKTILKEEPSKFKLFLWSEIFNTKRNLLKKFIFLNQLYLKQGEEIYLSVKIEWEIIKEEDTILKLKLNKTSLSKIDKKLIELERELETLFESKLLKKENNLADTTYFLILKESEQETIILDDKFQELKNNNELYLDKNHKWKLKDFVGCLISGPSGSGKSRVSYAIIKQMLSVTDNDLIFVCDPKRDELQEVCRYNFGLKNVYTTKEQIQNAIFKFKEEMDKRYERKEKERLRQNAFPYTFLIIDEFATLKTFFNKKEWAEIESCLTVIANMGRAANTRVLFISQRPSAELFGDIREQLSVRILMGNPVNAETYKMALGENRNNSDIITRKFREGFINYDGKIEDFKAPNILFPDEELTG